MNARSFLSFGMMCLLGLITLAGATRSKAQQMDSPLYLTMQEAEHLKSSGDYLGARVAFDEALYFFDLQHRIHPSWQAGLITSRMSDCRSEIARLEPLAAQQALQPATRASAAAIFDEGVRQETAGNDENALQQFERSLMILQLIQNHDPAWKPGLVQQKVKQSWIKVEDVRDRLAAHLWPAGTGAAQ